MDDRLPKENAPAAGVRLQLRVFPGKFGRYRFPSAHHQQYPPPHYVAERRLAYGAEVERGELYRAEGRVAL